MARWNPKSTLNIAPNGGIIALWNKTNVFDKNPWSTQGDYGKDIFYYFIIPAGFVFSGTVDTFTFNFGLKYVFKEREVTGYVNHSGQRWLQEGKTEKFWSLDESSPPDVTIQTDPDTKLPFLIVPDCGLPNFKEEKRYFIPLPQTA